MLRKLNPDELEDVGDLIGAFDDLGNKFHLEREMDLEEICYAHLFLGVSYALENLSVKNAETLVNDIFDLVFKNKFKKGEI